MSVLKDLLERRDSAQAELESLVRMPDGQDRELSGDDEQRTAVLLKDIDEVDKRIDEESVLEERRQALAKARGLLTIRSDVSVLDEPRMYGPNSPYSHYADTARVALYPDSSDLRSGDARRRLGEWSHQIEREVALGSTEGRSAEKQIVSHCREGGVNPQGAISEARQRGRVGMEEKRTGITTGGGATASASGGGGAAFVSPVFYLQDYAPYREFGRAFTDQCTHQPLPDYGMDVYIPQVTGPANVSTQTTEGTAVTETDPTAGYLSAQLATLAGQVTVSQQLLDRAGPGFSFDKMIFDQLNRDYAPKLDVKVLTAALSGAGSIVYPSPFKVVSTSGTTGSFYSQVSYAKVQIRTTAGTVLNPTHLFFQPSRWEYISAWGDGNARPIIVPEYGGPWNAAGNSGDGDAGVEGASGAKFNGLSVYTDANIPAPVSGADQAIVGDLSEVYVFEGNPVTRAVPQTLAGNLQVILQMWNYAGVIVRYPAAIQAISGTAMAAITF